MSDKMTSDAATIRLALEGIRNDSAARRIGYYIVLLTFGVFGSWAALAPIDSAALASGVVMVENYRKTVQHLEGGIVRELKVREGDQVSRGDVLLILDSSSIATELEMLRSQLIAAEAQEARLLAERSGLEELSLPDKVQVNARLLEAWEGERQIFTARRNAQLGEVDLLEKTIVQLKEQGAGLHAVIHNKQSLLASHEEEIGDLQALLAEGFVDKMRLREHERNLARARAEIAEHQSAIAQAQLRIGEAQLQILQLNKRFASEVAGLLTQTQSRLFDLREQIGMLEERLERTTVRAPESGMVIGMNVHTVGGVIGAGAPLMDIVPVDEALVVEAHISPTDIDRVAPGKPADIRFSAFNSATTPVIQGVLTQVSADRLVDKQSGQPYYLGRVALTDEGRRMLGDLKLLPGMPAEVLINSGSRTLLQYLLQPAGNMMARAMNED
jgi:membrane fusion protein, epimerase transport system